MGGGTRRRLPLITCHDPALRMLRLSSTTNVVTSGCPECSLDEGGVAPTRQHDASTPRRSAGRRCCRYYCRLSCATRR